MNARLPEGVLARADFPMLRLVHIHRLEPAFDRLPLVEARQRHCALFRHAGHFIGVLEDPLATDLQQWVEARAGGWVDWYVVAPADLKDWFAKQAEGLQPARPVVVPEEVLVGVGGTAANEGMALDADATSPVVRLVNATLQDALRLGASDIHFESTANGLAIRFRLDGVLEAIGGASGRAAAEQTVSRLKVLAELDIAERRVPQDGRFSVQLDDRRIDVRLSVMPSSHGEDAVLRILDKRRLVPDGENLSLARLGYPPEDLARMRDLAHQPYGMLLVTGPTGSGKTTTLYGVLAEIHDGRDKLVTIEDPVEYELPGVLQIPVNERKGLTFARGLRSILRHDPDKIMVGEIRDAETAEIAVQSALTGHLVLSTVHANNVFDVFSRFAHLGIDPYSLTTALNGVWAQRLVRTVCSHCAEPIIPTSRELAALGLPAEAAQGGDFRRGHGCGECRGTGYRGRRAVAEILALDDRLRTLIAQRAPLADIKAEARRQGMRSLRDAALALARSGTTTLEEVARVTAQN